MRDFRQTFLFKGHEDLHLDERTMQLLRVGNLLLSDHSNRSATKQTFLVAGQLDIKSNSLSGRLSRKRLEDLQAVSAVQSPSLRGDSPRDPIRTHPVGGRSDAALQYISEMAAERGQPASIWPLRKRTGDYDNENMRIFTALTYMAQYIFFWYVLRI